MKLQDAFVSESGTYFGSWGMIGYSMQTTNNVFTYDSTGVTFTNKTAALTTGGRVWKATPKANLNECTTSMFWQIKISAGGSNGAQYDAEVSEGPGGKCDLLAPGFGKLDKDGVVSTPST